MSLTFSIQSFSGGVGTQQVSTYNQNLRAVANYVHSICGAYAVKAKGIIGQNSGQIIYNPNTGQLLNGLITQTIQAKVGEAGSGINTGATVYVINDSRIVAGTLKVFADGNLVPIDQEDIFSYNVNYTPTQITVTFNSPLQANVILRFEYFKGGQTNNVVTKSTQPTLYATPTAGATSVIFSDIIGLSLSDILFVFRGGLPKVPVLGATTDMNQIQINFTTGAIVVPTGDIYTGTEVVAIGYLK
jgi:hypothetical protein